MIRDGRALLIRRGSEPLKGEWSIPGGLLELGETIIEGVARELLEETGLKVRVIELIEVFERIFPRASAGRRGYGGGARCRRGPAASLSLCDSRLSLRGAGGRAVRGRRRHRRRVCHRRGTGAVSADSGGDACVAEGIRAGARPTPLDDGQNPPEIVIPRVSACSLPSEFRCCRCCS